ncbi:hypothetical protein BBJ28_00024223 [Nothophytophthora sp. Chile5]|nr:hypothetical protein BBJ28_00024223 [Nothophytophthora sp. Chile5]
MFTNVGILTGGQTVYFGPREHIIPHFVSLGYACPQYRDPAEHFINLANTDFEGHGDIVQLVAGYASSHVASRIRDCITTDSTSLHGVKTVELLPPSPLRQFNVLLHRNLLNNLRNPGIYWVRLAMYTVLSLMMGTMYLSSNKALVANDLVLLIVYANVFLTFMSIAVLPFFIEQRAIFLRERANNGLNVASYVAANFLGALPGIFVIALSSTLLVVYLAGLNSYGIFLLTIFLSLMAAEGLMHVIAACVPHFIVGMGLGAGIYGMFILCMGLFVPRPAIPSYWLWGHYLGFFSYGFEALMHNQFSGSDAADAKTVLARYDMEHVDLGRDLAVLAANAAAFELLFACILYKFHTGRR